MVLIKCCDISNEVRPTEVAEPWVDCLLEEYFMQVKQNAFLLFIQDERTKKKRNFLACALQSDREKTEGLPVAPFMDRDKVTKPTAQIGFIKFVLIPMFETVMKVRLSSVLYTLQHCFAIAFVPSVFTFIGCLCH